MTAFGGVRIWEGRGESRSVENGYDRHLRVNYSEMPRHISSGLKIALQAPSAYFIFSGTSKNVTAFNLYVLPASDLAPTG